MPGPFISRAAPLLLLLVLLPSPPALAKEGAALLVGAGPLASYTTGLGNEQAWGLGAELSVNAVEMDGLAGFSGGGGSVTVKGGGLFAQWQRFSPRHDRFCLGAQAFYKFFGLELGLARETATERYAHTTSLHLAPFVSGGYVSAGLRVGIPLAHGPLSGQERRGVDLGIVLTGKLFLPLSKG
jgi:hypothetical protein